MSKHAHADIVAGEASESDEEISNEPGKEQAMLQYLELRFSKFEIGTLVV